jgi:nitrate/nitrite-specific signal transduction histidine kinase
LHFGERRRYAAAAVPASGSNRMGDYQIGGGLRLLTALEKTEGFAEFLKTRMIRALETQDPTELHYLLAQLDDYYSYMWRYYKKLMKERGDRVNPDV